MHKNGRCQKIVLLALIFLVSLVTTMAEELVPKLSIGGGGHWRKSVSFTITNNSDINWTDRIVRILLADPSDAKEPESLPLAGQYAPSIRFCDASNVEYIFNIVSPEGEEIKDGSIPSGSTLQIPVTCESKKSVELRIYFDNPKAWILPDRLKVRGGLSNLDMENGKDGYPTNWSLDGSDETSKLSWSEENPYSGRKCIKCEVATSAAPSWIGARQNNIEIVPGGEYLFEAYVRGKDIKGSCGWFLHVGNNENSMLASPMLYGGTGTYDWKKVKFTLKVPDNCNLLTFGTVLHGSGVAWYDAVKVTALGSKSKKDYTVKIGTVKTHETSDWYPSTSGIGSREFKPSTLIKSGGRFALLRVQNDLGDRRNMVSLNPGLIESRWGRTFEADEIEIRDLRNKPVSIRVWNGQIFFSAILKGHSTNYFIFLEKKSSQHSGKSRRINAVESGGSGSGQAFPGTTMQTLDSVDAGNQPSGKIDGKLEAIPDFIKKANLVKDGDMEESDFEKYWKFGPPEQGVTYQAVDSENELLGKRSIEMTIDPSLKSNWRGFRQSVKVVPGSTYLCGYSIRTKSATGGFQLHLHQRTDSGELSSGNMSSLGKPVGGDTQWTRQSDVIKIPEDTTVLELHLTTSGAGAAAYDDLFLVAMDRAEPTEFCGGRDGYFQVPAIIKIFEDTTFSNNQQELGEKESAFAVMSQNEEETIQIALRSRETQKLQLALSEPIGRVGGVKLAVPQLSVVTTVPVDYPTSYYSDRSTRSKMIRKIPTASPGCDGWPGIWPDPLIPLAVSTVKSEKDLPKVSPDFAAADLGKNDSIRVDLAGRSGCLKLEANKTRGIQLLFRSDKKTPAGLYDGFLFVKNLENGTTKRIPYTIEVLDFSIPDRPVKSAIYDVRGSVALFGGKRGEESKKLLVNYLVNRRLYPDQIPASPTIKYDSKTGRVTSDWTEYDKYASWYFDELGIKYAYTPNFLYLFGWGLPPRTVAGVNPYPGENPYKGADRSKLQPEYKKAYQAILREFWTHVKAKGWADRYVLYISDEPFYTNREIIDQMRALCDMIHEVDAKIPIYSSTWRHVPEWDGYINVWGIGHSGLVPPEQIKKIQDAGGRIWWTTDGQMCLDTPYCAVERLLPYSCVRWGAEAYEFWGATWYTYNPFDYGWHSYIPQSDQPGVHYFVRYPNGDGYILYPGGYLDRKGAISSIRLEQAREGVEDSAWLTLFKSELDKRAGRSDELTKQAQLIWNRAMDLVPIPCAGGRWSSSFLKNPEQIDPLRYELGKTLVRMLKEK